MKTMLAAVAIGMSVLAAWGQGTVNFVNRIPGVLDAPVFDTDGTTRLAGSAFRAQLYAGPTAAALAPVGLAVPFRTGVGAGYFDTSSGTTREIPTVAPGATAHVQIRVWESAKGASYEAARAAGGRHGSSPVMTVVTGGAGTPPTIPPSLVALTSFRLETGSPPTIADILVSASPKVGAPLRLEAVVTGTGPFTYQWLLNGSAIAGATSAVYSRSSAVAGTYAVRVTNAGGSVTREAITLSNAFSLELVVGDGGQVQVQPLLASYPAGTVVTLTAVPQASHTFGGWLGDLSGTGNPATLVMDRSKRVEAHFRTDGGTIHFANRNLTAGIDAPVFDLDGVTRLEGDAYLAQLFAGASAESLAPVGAPVPFRTGIEAGYFLSEVRTVSTVAPGSVAQVQVRVWPRSAGSTYDQAVAAKAKHGASAILAVVTGNAGVPPTLPAPLTGLESFQLRSETAPRIVRHPASVTVKAGDSARFEVEAQGSGPLVYQWRREGADLAGATGPILELPSARGSDAGRYTVRVSNAHGAAVSNPATLTVTQPAEVRLEVVASSGGRVVVTPLQATYPVGSRVTVEAIADAGYVFSGWSGDYAGSASPVTLILDGAKSIEAVFRPVNGTVLFANSAGSVDAPIFDSDGRTRLSGPGYLAQLYAGATAEDLAPVGAALAFRTGEAAGYFPGEVRSIPGIAPGARVRVQVRVWAASAGATYEAARAAKGKVGTSRVLEVVTGNLGTPPTLPALLTGLESFRVDVLEWPEITRIEAPVRVLAGERALLKAEAKGSAPLAYQWYQGAVGDVARPVGTNRAELETERLFAAATFWLRVSNPAGHTDSASIPIAVERRPQTVAVGPLIPVTYGVAPFVVPVLSSSGLPVTVAVVSGPGEMDGNRLKVLGAGAIRLRASQGGNEVYLPAPDVEDAVVVLKASATLRLTRLQQVFDGTPKTPDVQVQPSGVAYALSFDGSPAAPTAPGRYGVVASITDPNYAGSARAEFEIVAARNLGGWVFHDRNGDGARNAGEEGLGGVSVHVLGLDAATRLHTGQTDAAGGFAFDGVAPGSYYVQSENPAGFVSTTPDLRRVSVTADAPTEVLFGDQQAGTVGGVVFDDGDGDGQRDSGEPGLGGVTIRLTGEGGTQTAVSGTDGSYSFGGVAPGSYTIEETDLPGYGSTTPNVRLVSVAPGGAATANFGDHAVGTISGAVFLDINGNGQRESGEPGLEGVTVRLQGDGWQQSRLTDANGEYAFAGLEPGSYTVEELDPLHYTSTTPNLRTVTLSSGASAVAHFGDQATGTVGGVVFEDVDGNGRFESGERGLGGVLLKLAGAAGQHSARTASDGTYLFLDVEPGSYTIEETDPVGFSSTTPNLRTLAVANGGSATANFGDQAAGSIAGMVFADANGNGLRESEEPGLGGVAIRLIGAEGQRTAVTAGDGSYQFAGLTPGHYTVEETDPVGFVSTTPNVRAVSLTSGGSAGASFGDQAVRTISGAVFEDQDGNGQFDPGEPGLAGVGISLLRADNDEVVRRTVTSGSGHFVFADVPAGDYVVRQVVPDAYTVVTTGGSPAARRHDGHAPAGFVEKPVSLEEGGAASVSFANHVVGQLTGMVFNDLDGDGLPSAAEPGLGGVRVEVRQGDTGEVVATAWTSGGGRYLVAGLSAGAYEAVQDVVPGYATPLRGVRVSLQPGGAAVANFANRAHGTVSGLVFNDEDGDGRHDAAEPGMGGVRVTLVGADGSSRDAFSAGDGAFLFTGVQPGPVTVSQATPEGFRATTGTTAALTLAAEGAASAWFGNQGETLGAPVLVSVPDDVTVDSGSDVTLSAGAEGASPLTWQWLKDGTPIEGATRSTLELARVRASDAGLYQVRVSNAFGTAESDGARLTVQAADPFNTWVGRQGLPPTARRPHDDPDGDGLSNLMEFLLGTLPAAATENGRPALRVAQRNGAAFLGYEFARAREAAGLRVYLEASDDLVHWQEVESDLEVLPGDDNSDLVRISDRSSLGSRPVRFVRLGVSSSAPAAPPGKLNLRSGNPAAGRSLTLEGEVGRRYRVEWSTDLKTWNLLAEVTGDAEPVPIADDGAAGATLRFYRVLPRP